MLIRPFEDSDEEAVLHLWSLSDLVRPWNDPRKDIARKRQVQRELFLVGTIDGVVTSTVMAGYDGHRGWVNYLAVQPELRKQGLGRAMMMEVQDRLQRLGCAKINLQVRNGNLDAIAFYERIGFVADDVISLGKRLVPDDF